MSDFDISADVELGSRASADAQWEQAKLDIPRHDAEFEAAQGGCVFCQIIAGTADATFVAETDESIAIIPRDPVTGDMPEGHVLVIPRKHAADFIEDGRITATTTYDAAWLARVLRSRYGGDWNLITSAGADATQTVFHLHVHLVRRVPGDSLHLPWTGQRVTR